MSESVKPALTASIPQTIAYLCSQAAKRVASASRAAAYLGCLAGIVVTMLALSTLGAHVLWRCCEAAVIGTETAVVFALALAYPVWLIVRIRRWWKSARKAALLPPEKP